MRIAIVGATGLVGSSLVPLLVRHRLLVLTRKPTGQPVEECVAPAAAWPDRLAGERVDVAICALGSTWRKAGSWQAFEQLDRHVVLAFARAARRAQARQFVLVSSVGADPHSANPYLAIKGRTEADLAQVGFDRLDLLRPGLLGGHRGRDRRLMERIAIALSPATNLLLRGPRDRFAAIPAQSVAKAIAAVIGKTEAGAFIHHNREIRALASHA